MTWISFGRDTRTVDRFSEYTSQSSLSDTMKTKEDISMVKGLSFAGISEYFFYEILANNIGKHTRAI